MIRVIDGIIKQTRLLKSGQLSTGETISGCHLLSQEILKVERWLP